MGRSETRRRHVGPVPPTWVRRALHAGIVIPAHPLALDDQGRWDTRSQRALTRYYHAAGAGGIAVGVHTTQFEIRAAEHGLLQPVLELTAEAIDAADQQTKRQTVRIAGVCGETSQAVAEARLAAELGYHAGLLSLAALPQADDDRLLQHCEAVAEEIPLFGFYLQPAVGGRPLSVDFWRRFAQIPNLVGIKLAPFDRYKTLDVVRAVAEAGRSDDVVLYTGNDDAIVSDLLTEYAIPVADKDARVRMVGGLLGHWACWTQRAHWLLSQCKTAIQSNQLRPELLTLGGQVTDCNAALFDAANGFAGCIAGIQYVLYRQGLLSSPRCLDPNIGLSAGQQDAIERVRRIYPHLIDDSFVENHREGWLA
ncbi:dihydrodipicolinate synthase family protein [Roseiconus nitratireducens]|uniref:Dihydrodipicolinate synthase family protein n=1 Tax=Roseiconus nitratireducens TaxID=2605748 RepID=A0A5M6DI98_9BACT|nr:dihydrodipicolinate synthase family protein [Roseiconus nitratireducens]KAA5547211.1 dihydrodipicolinate synthase family protein [Roseiconus nitratireducens]